MSPTYETELADALELMAVPGEPGKEGRIAEVVREKLLAMGVGAEAICTDQAHRSSELGGETGNLIVRLDGHGRGQRRMISTHLDTVPGCVGSKPRRAGGRVVNDAPGKALGVDARAGCAVVLAAARALAGRRGDHPPWTLVFFVQEEIGLVGSRWLDVALLGEPLPAMAFNFDGGEPEEVTAAVIGTERLHITVRGVAAHSSRPIRGISAAVIGVRAAAEMADAGWHGPIDRPEGRGLANLGILRGGTGSNVVMPELYALVEARSHEKDFRSRIIAEWTGAFRRAVEQANAEADQAAGQARVDFAPGPVYDPYALPDDAPVVRAALDAARRAGLEPRRVTDDGGQDSAWIVAHGIPAVGLGFGARASHSEDEWMDVVRFQQACRLAVELASAG